MNKATALPGRSVAGTAALRALIPCLGCGEWKWVHSEYEFQLKITSIAFLREGSKLQCILKVSEALLARMKKRWLYVPGFLGFAYIVAIVVFPLEFIRYGQVAHVFFEPFNHAVSLAKWHWKHGLRYDCDSISLLGYTSSFSVVVPAYIDGEPSNLITRVDPEKVILVQTSDRIIDTHVRYSDLSAQLNNAVFKDCGFEKFE